MITILLCSFKYDSSLLFYIQFFIMFEFFFMFLCVFISFLKKCWMITLTNQTNRPDKFSPAATRCSKLELWPARRSHKTFFMNFKFKILKCWGRLARQISNLEKQKTNNQKKKLQGNRVTRLLQGCDKVTSLLWGYKFYVIGSRVQGIRYKI